MIASAMSRTRALKNAALLELIGQHEPEDRMILIGGILGGGFLGVADSLDQPFFIERQARNRRDHGAKIGGEIAGIEASSPRAHIPTTPTSLPVAAKMCQTESFAQA
jgi:hypothetical protein